MHKISTQVVDKYGDKMSINKSKSLAGAPRGFIYGCPEIARTLLL